MIRITSGRLAPKASRVVSRFRAFTFYRLGIRDRRFFSIGIRAIPLLPRRPSVLPSPCVPPIDPRHLESLHALLEEWAALWRVPHLAKSVGLRTSSRLRRSLGTYRPARSQITLAAWLLEDAPRPLLEEVLCHEAAHAAVHLSCSGRVRPHGSDWRDLMLAAGRIPRVRIPELLLPKSQQARLAGGRLWEHRCPVCQATRMARTRVTRWRCRQCVMAGRSGRLVIERIGSPIRVDA